MWLIGMMGSGKTTVGRRAAAQVGVPFYDTDQMVVEIAHMPISAIWEGVGEEGFREVVWLRCTPEVLAARVRGDGSRPLDIEEVVSAVIDIWEL